MSQQVVLIQSSSICPLCNGNSCRSCKQGEVACIEWECRRCNASGEGVPAACDVCGNDDVEESTVDDEPDFDDYEPVMGDDGYYY